MSCTVLSLFRGDHKRIPIIVMEAMHLGPFFAKRLTQIF